MSHNSQYLDQKSKQSSSTQPYIGAHVTLISSLDVRYEGVLFTIDPNESTVALQEVRCLGTEERQTGEKAIEKSDTVYEFIIFRGENIKSICLSNKGQKQNKKPINDPSIIKVGDVKEPSRKTVTPMPSGQDSTLRPQQSYDSYHHREPQQYQPHRRPQQHWSQHRQPQRNNHYNNRRQHHQQYNNNYNPQRRGYNNYQQRRGGYRNYNQGSRGGYRRRYNKRNPENQPGNAKFLAKGREEKDKFETEFDFDASNARFDKTDVLEQPVVEVVEEKEENVEEVPAEQPAETTEESTEAAVPAAVEESENVTEEVEKKADPAKEAPKLVYTYKAENFFDDLDTNDTENRVSDLKTRRKLDAETFGEEARTYSPKVYRRRRYRNKGGRYNNNRRYNNNYNNNRRYNNNYNRRGGYNNYNNQRYNNYNNNQNQVKKESVEPESAV